jgi:hypothetical protein
MARREPRRSERRRGRACRAPGAKLALDALPVGAIERVELELSGDSLALDRWMNVTVLRSLAVPW